MSATMLKPLYDELRRIYVAGSNVATGDERLNKLLPKLRQMGEHSAVIAKLAEEAAGVVECNEPCQYAMRLQQLTSRLYSVLRIMGDGAASGEQRGLVKMKGLHERESLPEQPVTPLSYRELTIALSALSGKGEKSIDQLYAAKERGLFCDLRLLKPALALLNDKKLSSYAALFVLPSFGRAVLPYVEEDFQMKGKKRDADKLAVIAAVRDEEVDDLVLQCARKGSAIVRKAAIRSMMGKVRFQEELIALTSARNKMMKEEAYYALAECPTDRAMGHMMACFQSDDYKLAGNVAHFHENPLFDEAIVQALRDLISSARERLGDEEQTQQGRQLLIRYLLAMRGKPNAAMFDVFRQVSSEVRLFYELGWLKWVYDEAVIYLRMMGTRKELTLMFELEKMGPPYISDAVSMAAEILSPQEFYDRYYDVIHTKWSTLPEKLFQKWKFSFKKSMAAVMNKQVKEALQSVDILDHERWVEAKCKVPFLEWWDERWLDWAIDEDEPIIVSNLARPGHERCRSYMEHELLMEKEGKHFDFLEHADAQTRKNFRYYSFIVEHLLLGMRRIGMDSERKWEAIMRMIEHPENEDIYAFNDGLIEVHAINLPIAFRPRVEAKLIAIGSSYPYTFKQMKMILARMDEKSKEQR